MTNTTNLSPTRGIDTDLLDLPSLVGREVVLYSEQYPGRPLATRVIMASNLSMSLDRGRGSALIDSLLNDQRVVLQFEYRGELVSVNATLNRSPHGQCHLTLAETVVPLTRRKFPRFRFERSTNMAFFNHKNFDPQHLSRLRWIETKAINISCGGVLLALSTQARQKTYFLLNVNLTPLEFPKFVIGQVRHSYQDNDGRFHAGIEFVVSEKKAQYFNQFTIKDLPEAFFEYTIPMRTGIGKELVAGALEHPANQ